MFYFDRSLMVDNLSEDNFGNSMTLYWVISRLIGWLIYVSSVGWLVDWLVDWLIDWSIDWLIDW